MDFNSNSNREKIITIICMVGLALFILSRSCGNDSSSSNTNSSAYTTNTSKSPVGSYREYRATDDKNTYFQYNINSDGTASITGRTSAGIKNGIMTYEDRPTLHTYWEYLEGNTKEDIRIRRKDIIDSWEWCYIDFSEKKIYFSYESYRAKHGGSEIIKIN